MSNALIYMGSWKLANDSTEVQVNIQDMTQFTNPGDDPLIIDLQMGASPLIISVIDSNLKLLKTLSLTILHGTLT